MKVLFVGQIRKYKNVEYILRLAREHEKDAVDFLVAGKVESETYKSELIESAQGLSNIKFLFGYLDESDMANLILRSDLLITPYNKVSSLNSGTIFLAFTLGTTCVCPNIGSAMDVHNKNAFYMYEYNAEEDHYVNLNAMFCNALEDYKSGALQKKGKLCVQEVNLYNSLEKVKSGYEKLLRKITS